MACGYIDDGYTLDGFIKEEAGLYPAVRFKFRPLTADEQIRNFSDWHKIAPSERSERSSQMVASKVVSWDLKDSKGATVAIKAVNCKRLKYELSDRIVTILCDSRLSDHDEPNGNEGFAEDGLGNLPPG